MVTVFGSGWSPVLVVSGYHFCYQVILKGKNMWLDRDLIISRKNGLGASGAAPLAAV